MNTELNDEFVISSAAELNQRSRELCLRLYNEPAFAKQLQVQVSQNSSGATLLDFGSQHTGTLESGLLLSRICLADLADVSLVSDSQSNLRLPRVQVRTDHPLAACIGGQYAGWPFSVGDYFAMCSGPARMARGHEELLTQYDLTGKPKHVVGIFESSTLPDELQFQEFADECGVPSNAATICIARTASLPGTLQVVARSIETTMHKLFEIGFDLRHVKNAMGSAPMPPIAGDDLTALGWTNDSILYGSIVSLWVDCDDECLDKLGPQIPSCASKDFGRPFLEIFNEYDRDFYKVDKHLFSPAMVSINNLSSGKTFQFGQVRNDLLADSFGL